MTCFKLTLICLATQLKMATTQIIKAVKRDILLTLVTAEQRSLTIVSKTESTPL